jgi:four helix bundle protein
MGKNFDHRRLDVYAIALRFLAVAHPASRSFPRGNADLADQLRRASTSIVLNIAEGAGEYAPGDKARFYRMARRSSTECAAIVDVAETLGYLDVELADQMRDKLRDVAAMLTAMVKRMDSSLESIGSQST